MGDGRPCEDARISSKDDPARTKYVTQLNEMAARVAALQGPDGLRRAGMLDPSNYSEPEISGSALFTYALAWESMKAC